MKQTILIVGLLIVLGSAGSAPLQQGGSSGHVQFAPPIIIPSPQAFSSGIASGDFNNDGIPDLATVSTHNCVLNTALGNGDGTFQQWIITAFNPAPSVVALGKFDGPNLDALINDIEDGGAALFLGDGNGNFPKYKYINNGGGYVEGIAVGDFNNDHNQDLAFVEWASTNGNGRVYVALGNGDASFQSAQVFPTGGAYPSLILTGDFNGDGELDLVIVNSGSQTQKSSVAVLLGNGDGTFGEPMVFGFSAGSVDAMTVGDFNGDGKLDLAVSVVGQGTTTLTTLLGNGDGTFHARHVDKSVIGPYSLAAADFNGDGKLDLVGLTSGLVVLLGDGRGDFHAPAFFSVQGQGPAQLTVADFNLDGKPDVAVLNSLSPTVSILLNTTPFPSKDNSRIARRP